MMACKRCMFNVINVESTSFRKGFQKFSTTAAVNKKTPHTIGVMSWVRSAYRRKYLENKMKEDVKSELQVIKEHQLNRTEPRVEFQTTSRNKERFLYDENNIGNLLVKPTVFLSKDEKTLICYHPPPKNYPESFTKRAVGQHLFGLDREIVQSFKDQLSKEEINEAEILREENPRLWNTNSLSLLFKTKPGAIISLVPLTKAQFDRATAENEVFKSMSKMKRKQVQDLQQWERLKYIASTRGREYSVWFKLASNKPSAKAYVPPKF